MNQLIRSLVELAKKEKCKLDDIQKAILMQYEPSVFKRTKDLSKFEMKLLDRFLEAFPNLSEVTVKRDVRLVEIYCNARKKGMRLSITELANLASQQLDLQPTTIKRFLKSTTWRLQNVFLENNLSYERSSKKILEIFYCKHGRDLIKL